MGPFFVSLEAREEKENKEKSLGLRRRFQLGVLITRTCLIRSNIFPVRVHPTEFG